MKTKLIVGFIIVAPMLAVNHFTTDEASKNSSWEKFSTLFQVTKSNTSAYTVEAAGWNVRVIEWVPATNLNIRCMFVAGTEKAGTACYKVASVKLLKI